MKKNAISFAFPPIFTTFALATGKGNGVRVPNCPAAVSSQLVKRTLLVTDILGKTFALGCKSEDLPAVSKSVFRCLWG